MHHFPSLKFLTSLPLILILGTPNVFAKPEKVDADLQIKTLAPTSRQDALDRTIANLLSQHHYRQSPLDVALSSLVL
ncbi:MAG: hypothetical protein H6975_11455, partial [Gammaproteobacteria bacterium]|nr:hypothetical protein [Gammaproteobacteria bacterium]